MGPADCMDKQGETLISVSDANGSGDVASGGVEGGGAGDGEEGEVFGGRGRRRRGCTGEEGVMGGCGGGGREGGVV